ncbi:hypothetical protein R1521_33660, partial [Rhizobium brockwellii]
RTVNSAFRKNCFFFEEIVFPGKISNDAQMQSFPGFRPDFTRPEKMNVFRLFVERTPFCVPRPDIITICWS